MVYLKKHSCNSNWSSFIIANFLFIRYVKQANEPTNKEHSILLRELEKEELTVQAVLAKKQRYEDRWLHINEQQKEKERQYTSLEYKIQLTEVESEEATQTLQHF